MYVHRFVTFFGGFFAPEIAPLVAAAIIGAGASAAQGVYQSSQISGANKQSRKFAREVRAWEEQMANTAHQREVADLRAAGLNPILSGTGGAGAGVPGAPMATSLPELGTESIAGGAASAAAAYVKSKEMDLLEANTRKAGSEANIAQDQELETANRVATDNARRSFLMGTSADAPRNRQEEIWDAEYRSIVGAPRLQQAQVESLSTNIDQARQQIRNLTRQYNIAGSAEAQAALDEEIAKSTYGELSAWWRHFMSNITGPIGEAIGGAVQKRISP